MKRTIKATTVAGVVTFGTLGQQDLSASESKFHERPNFIIIFTDDLGYGDIGVYGNPTIKTPNLDKMAFEGQKWSSFYVAAPTSTPSRAGLLTGRLPIRSGMCSSTYRVLTPESQGGLPPEEVTLAKILKENGYRTACIGKWHLGHQSPYLPIDHGFESFYGIPYSNDMNKVVEKKRSVPLRIALTEKESYEAYDVPLMRDKEIIERPIDQRTMTKRFTEETVKKIWEFKDQPFFIYLAHPMPHTPLFRSEKFKGISKRGLYGDVIEEIDWSTGEIMKALKQQGIAENTLVVFTSDNGPWHIFQTHGGSAGMLNGAKAGTWDGGMRVPAIFWWPGKLQPGVVMEMATTMDLFPTFCRLSKIGIPDDRVYDGYDLSPLLFGTGKSERDIVFYYCGHQLYAIRKGDYKAHFIIKLEYGNDKTAHFITNPELDATNEPKMQIPPLLYNLCVDPSEKYDIAKDHPEIIAEIRQIMNEHKAGIIPVENQLEKNTFSGKNDK